MWLDCYTAQEIAYALDIPVKTAKDETEGFGESVLEDQTTKSHANHSTDFGSPIYNIWKRQRAALGDPRPGNP